MASWWTIKVAGVSGTGKTTLMNKLNDSLEIPCQTIVYSSLLQEQVSQKAADVKLEELITSFGGLSIMDDHLEFDNPSKTANYIRENTKGIILLDVPLHDLVARIQSDASKDRDINLSDVSEKVKKSREKAIQLAYSVKIPLLTLPNREGELMHSVKLASNFILANSPFS